MCLSNKLEPPLPTGLGIIIDLMCLCLLKFTPSEFSGTHANTCFFILVGFVVRNKYFNTFDHYFWNTVKRKYVLRHKLIL